MTEKHSDKSKPTPEADPFHDFTVPQDADFATSKNSDGDDIEDSATASEE